MRRCNLSLSIETSGADDLNRYYLIESMSGGLLMGDVMAVLAECQNRQTYGVDRWAGVIHYTGRFRPVPESSDPEFWDYPTWQDILEKMADDVSVKVAVAQAWNLEMSPAFSLRRLSPPESGEPPTIAEQSSSFLHELIVHPMISIYGVEYQWDWWDSRSHDSVIKLGEYEGNLVAVKEHPRVFLAEYSHTLRLLSNI